MTAQTVLWDILKKREREFHKYSRVESRWTPEEYRQLLIVDPDFPIDIVSLMDMWSKERAEENKKKNTSFSVVSTMWSKAGKDRDEQKNRRNFINALIKNNFVCLENGVETKICQFLTHNSQPSVNNWISRSSALSLHTRNTYKNGYRSLLKFIDRFIHGPTSRRKNYRTLIKAVRALELFEAAHFLEEMEKKALKSDVAMRDLLIMRLIIYGGEGVEIKSILSLERDAVNFSENFITVKTRRGASLKPTKQIKCSSDFMKLLKSYLGRRKRKLFADSEGEIVEQDHINKRLSRISQDLKIVGVWLKYLQRSYVYILKQNGLIRHFAPNKKMTS